MWEHLEVIMQARDLLKEWKSKLVLLEELKKYASRYEASNFQIEIDVYQKCITQLETMIKENKL